MYAVLYSAKLLRPHVYSLIYDVEPSSVGIPEYYAMSLIRSLLGQLYLAELQSSSDPPPPQLGHIHFHKVTEGENTFCGMYFLLR
jgi:hypothetical protein